MEQGKWIYGQKLDTVHTGAYKRKRKLFMMRRFFRSFAAELRLQLANLTLRNPSYLTLLLNMKDNSGGLPVISGSLSPSYPALSSRSTHGKVSSQLAQ
jgi:hypothetical protein